MQFSCNTSRVQFWEDYIICQNGAYIYVDQQGKCHSITHEEARKKERDFYRYQADMDFQRGGMEREAAYAGRGFTQTKPFTWEYLNYKVDKLK